MSSLLTPEMKSDYDDALASQFDSFKRAYTVYVDAGVAVISTAPDFAGMFGDQSQNNTVVPNTPQSYTLSGCILYGNKQPWEYVSPGTRANYQQDKIRESFGTIRVKVDASGYSLMRECKNMSVDGFQFKVVSAPRPHGLITPTRWTFTLQTVD